MRNISSMEWFYGTCALFALCFFAYFDLQIQGVIDVPVAYVSLPGLGLLARSRRLISLCGLLGVLATIIVYWMIPDLAGVIIENTNRNLAAVSIVTITLICLIYMNRQLEFEQNILKMSNTDELTGIYNRRALMQELEGRINESKRHGNELSLILFDIDDFKLINDVFGHSAGDDILKRLTRVCQNWLRTSDSMGRYGGEEFLVLCPNTSLDGAKTLAERIRQAVEQTGFFYRKNHFRVTISCGITELANHLKNHDGELNETELAHDMIDAADSAMYHAKKSGKNTIFAYEPHPQAKKLQSAVS
ncbi:MAG TPA: GGDEF domain-containing protein [Gammaproteobacteria bacterium]|nr:GGDEF domain-containing protein [Gammaproteobacteria bacterium]